MIHEVRNDFVDARDYDWTYLYDAGGDWTLKKEVFRSDPLRRFEEQYVYDIDDQVTYDTTANRLMTVERLQIDTDPGTQQSSSFDGPPGGRALCFGDSYAHVLGFGEEAQRLIATLAAYAA